MLTSQELQRVGGVETEKHRICSYPVERKTWKPLQIPHMYNSHTHGHHEGPLTTLAWVSLSLNYIQTHLIFFLPEFSFYLQHILYMYVSFSKGEL